MKALILSGGSGTRLRPITYTSAKQLVPVANKPILFYAIESIAESGITDIGIIVGETKEEVKAAVGDGSRWNAKVTYIEQDAPRGLAHAVMIAEEFMAGDSFIMFLGDNLLQSGVKGLVDDFNAQKPNATILLMEVEDPRSFGVAELKDGKVYKLVEKPKEPKSNLALVGVYLFDNNIFDAVKNIKPSWRNELEITDAIQYMVEKGYNVQPHLVKGWWKDTGKPEDVLDANRLMLEIIETDIKGTVDDDSQIVGRVIIEKGAKITNSIIRGPVIIGANTEVSNAYIGPFTAISNDCLIRESEIEHSIIFENSKITDIAMRIDGSLVGKDVVISKSDKKPSGIKLVIGDNSNIAL